MRSEIRLRLSVTEETSKVACFCKMVANPAATMGDFSMSNILFFIVLQFF